MANDRTITIELNDENINNIIKKTLIQDLHTYFEHGERAIIAESFIRIIDFYSQYDEIVDIIDNLKSIYPEKMKELDLGEFNHG